MIFYSKRFKYNYEKRKFFFLKNIDIDTAPISKNVQVDVPIVADAKEAVSKMLEYVSECETKKWLEKIEEWKMEHPLTMKNTSGA